MQFLYPIAQQTKFLSLRSDIEFLLCQLKLVQKMRSSSVSGGLSGSLSAQDGFAIDQCVSSCLLEEGRNRWVS